MAKNYFTWIINFFLRVLDFFYILFHKKKRQNSPNPLDKVNYPVKSLLLFWQYLSGKIIENLLINFNLFIFFKSETSFELGKICIFRPNISTWNFSLEIPSATHRDSCMMETPSWKVVLDTDRPMSVNNKPAKVSPFKQRIF